MKRGAKDRPLAAARGRLAIAILGPDAALVRRDDLARDRQAEAGILAERNLRPIGVEALEDAFEIVGPDPLAFVPSTRNSTSPWLRLTLTLMVEPVGARTSAHCREDCEPPDPGDCRGQGPYKA